MYLHIINHTIAIHEFISLSISGFQNFYSLNYLDFCFVLYWRKMIVVFNSTFQPVFLELRCVLRYEKLDTIAFCVITYIKYYYRCYFFCLPSSLPSLSTSTRKIHRFSFFTQ